MNRNFVILLLSSLLVLASTEQSAAQAVSSPYTFGSYGLMEPQGFMHQQFMGGLSSTVQSKGDYSVVNPASLHALEQTTLQTGSYLNFINQRAGDKENDEITGDFGYFGMGFPISVKNKIGFSANINRLTDLAYSIPGTAVEDSINVTNLFSGHGGINQFRVGLGAAVFKNFSVGISASFLSGNIQTQFDKQFQENKELYSVRNEAISYYSGVKWNAGVQYAGRIRKKTKFTIGLHASPQSTVTVSTDEQSLTYSYTGNYFIDTVSTKTGEELQRNMPLEYGGALSLGAENKWLVGVEYNRGKWADITAFRNSNPFFDQQTFTIGGYFQLIDEMNSSYPNFSEKARDYFKFTRIYWGLRSQANYTGVVGSQVNEMAVSLGFGFPITRVYAIEGEKYKMISRVNLGFEYLIRGENVDGMIQENIFGIKLGLTLTDKWFNKRKYQ